jgi:glycosyltransferase involved in cell wall biosynthesis
MAAQAFKLTFVLDHFIPWKAGTEHQLSMLLAGLPRDWQVHIIVFRDSEWLDSHAGEFNVSVSVIRINNFRSLATYANIFKLIKTLQRSSPDIVHTFFPVANIIGVVAARMAGVKQIISSRRDYGEWMTPRYLRATRFANRFATGVITNSGEVRQMSHKVEGLPLDQIRVIANGIDVDRFLNLPDRRECCEQLGLAGNNMVVGLVANFRPMKRQQTLIRAAALLAQDFPEARYLLIGTNATEEDIQSQLQRLAKDLGVSDKVRFEHSNEDIRRYLAALDIGVNCSEGEGLSNAIMEYMASGLPCIVANSGGNPDLVTDGKDGLLFEVDEAEELARHLATLYRSEGERDRLGGNARRTIASKYSIEAMVNSFVDYYTGGGQ